MTRQRRHCKRCARRITDPGSDYCSTACRLIATAGIVRAGHYPPAGRGPR